MGAVHHLSRGDRIALYTTHCTHEVVTGTVPDLLHPLRPFTGDTEEMFHDLTEDIAKCGTQSWDPPRPNPSMADVTLAVAKSLDGKDIKRNRTHIVLLSPTVNILHGVSNGFPSLYIHQINPAVLPYRNSQDPQERACREPCCANIFVSNWSHYQSLPGRIKQIIQYARVEKPQGQIGNVHVDIRPKKGCEVLGYVGATDFDSLRPGQVISFFVHIRVMRSQTQELDLSPTDPFLNSNLDASDLRQDVQKAHAAGATKVHLLSVQVMNQNSLLPLGCWTYTEAQLLVIKELGRSEKPFGTGIKLYERKLFYDLNELDIAAAKHKLEQWVVAPPIEMEAVKKLIERMLKEVLHRQSIQEYERMCRQKLPLCPGPIGIAATHEWLIEKWDAKKNKRKGMAVI